MLVPLTIGVGRDSRKKEKHFLHPIQEMGVKPQNGAPSHLLVLYFWRAGGIYVVKFMGSG
jgi:hypothetical protein